MLILEENRMRKARLKEIDLPDFGMPDAMPELDRGLYSARLARLRERVAVSGLDVLVIYADREHAANMCWLTGFEPRFEEALLILRPKAPPAILTGPENQGPAGDCGLETRVLLYPPFGLMGQDRSQTPPLADLLSQAGLAAGQKIGVCGWKYFSAEETSQSHSWLEIPSYIADAIRSLAGPSGSVSNAGSLFMHPGEGLRAHLEIDELARFEFAACQVSCAVRNVYEGARPGMSEFQIAALMRPVGLPLSCHAMMTSGPRAWHGLLSPSSRVVERGDAITTALGVQGALTCRNGWLAEGPEDLPQGVRDYVDRLVEPYFSAVAHWLETVGIGVRGGELYKAVMDRLGDPFFGVKLNPGHLIHLDEWMHSPVTKGGEIPLHSGMAIQVDVIPATGGPYFTSNMEDGIALLDQRGRDELRDRHPSAWRRIKARRAFMDEALGIRLKEEVLPFSNLASFLPPFWLSPRMGMTLR
jgi:hypothetical protein